MQSNLSSTPKQTWQHSKKKIHNCIKSPIPAAIKAPLVNNLIYVSWKLVYRYPAPEYNTISPMWVCAPPLQWSAEVPHPERFWISTWKGSERWRTSWIIHTASPCRCSDYKAVYNYNNKCKGVAFPLLLTVELAESKSRGRNPSLNGFIMVLCGDTGDSLGTEKLQKKHSVLGKNKDFTQIHYF